MEGLVQDSGFEEIYMKLFVFKFKMLGYQPIQKVQVAAPNVAHAFKHFNSCYPDIVDFSVSSDDQKVLIG